MADGDPDYRRPDPRHLHRVDAHVEESRAASLRAFLCVGFPWHAVVDPARHCICWHATTWDPAWRSARRAAGTDAQRDRLPFGNNSQWISWRSAWPSRGSEIAGLSYLVSDLEGTTAAGFPSDDSAARQFCEWAPQGYLDYLRHFHGRTYATQPNADAGEVRWAGSVLLRGGAVFDDDDRLGLDPAAAGDPLSLRVRTGD